MRRLGVEEAELWARVMASVRPLRAVVTPVPVVAPPPAAATATPPPPAPPRPIKRVKPVRAVVPTPAPVAGPKPPRGPGVTLDGAWDRRIGKGALEPDSVIDLHGHTLGSAHAMLDVGLERARARGDRVLLLVTGRPPRPESERPHARGAIRASVADWIAASRHASGIAAVRGAHPRHGGAGALYIVLRRPRDTGGIR